MMVKFYDKNLTREDFKNLQQGDVVRYSEDNYIIVHHADEKAAYGQIATTISVNSISVEDIVNE
ncbi:MAG: hypothetical protein ABIF18_03125 [archaeon]